MSRKGFRDESGSQDPIGVDMFRELVRLLSGLEDRLVLRERETVMSFLSADPRRERCEIERTLSSHLVVSERRQA